MKFAIGSRAYGKNSPFLAESDCFFDCLRKKEAEYEIIARKILYLTLVCAGLRYVSGKEWGSKRYLCMKYMTGSNCESEIA